MTDQLDFHIIAWCQYIRSHPIYHNIFHNFPIAACNPIYKIIIDQIALISNEKKN